MRRYGITGDINGQFAELAHKIAVDTRYTIEDLVDNSLSIETCISKIKEMGHLYEMTSRRFVMIYLYENLQLHQGQEDYTFTYSDGVEYTIFNPSLEKIDSLTELECSSYIDLLVKISLENNPGSDEEMWEEIMGKAMLKYADSAENALSRDEAIILAHGLHFDLNTTKDFLVRILDDGSFSSKSSNDLIEMFCFTLSGCNNIATVEAMKKEYAQYRLANPITFEYTCEDERSMFSKDTINIITEYEQVMKALSEHVNQEECPGIFLNWLKSKKCLDQPGKNAFRIYCNLINFYTQNYKEKLNVFDPDSNEDEECRYEILLNCLTDKAEPLTVATLESFFKKNVSLKYISGNEEKVLKSDPIRRRTIDILTGHSEVQKTDILIWLWFCHLILWYDKALNFTSDREIRNMLHQRYSEFLDHVQLFLDQSFLDIYFYPPHPLEYSMLLSIWGRENLSGKGTIQNPLDVYNDLCAGFCTHRSSFNARDKEAEIKKAYQEGMMDLEGIPPIIFDHLNSNIESLRKVYPSKTDAWTAAEGRITDKKKMLRFMFSTKGISITQYEKELCFISYPDKHTGNRFDKPGKRHADYNMFMSDESVTERCQFMYGIKYAIEDYAYSVYESYIELKPSYKGSFELRLIRFKWNDREDDVFRKRTKKERVHCTDVEKYFCATKTVENDPNV